MNKLRLLRSFLNLNRLRHWLHSFLFDFPSLPLFFPFIAFLFYVFFAFFCFVVENVFVLFIEQVKVVKSLLQHNTKTHQSDKHNEKCHAEAHVVFSVLVSYEICEAKQMRGYR